MSEQNKKTVQEYNKEYYETNKAKIREQQKTKVICLRCNRKVNSQNLTKHMKTKCCTNHMNKNLEILKYGKNMYETYDMKDTVEIINRMIEKITHT